MTTLRWSAAVAIAIGAAAAWLWTETRVASPESSATAMALAHDLASPRLAVTRPAANAPPATPPRAAEASNATDQEHELEARFASEHADATWANVTRSLIDADLARFTGKEASVRSIECRASLCRVELAVTDRTAGIAFAQSWLRERTFAGPIHGSQDDGTMVMYLGRPGTEL